MRRAGTRGAPGSDLALRLDHAVLHVSDVARSAAFYRALLGAQVDELSWGRTAFVIGEARLHVHAPDSTPYPRPAAPAAPGSGDFCFEWDGTADAALEHVRLLGLAAIAGPVERVGARGTGLSLYLHDPDGNLVELISYA